MNMNETALNINQIVNLICVNGDAKSYVIEGPMGSGKSTTIDIIRKKYGDGYYYANVDCTQWDIGDIQMPDIDKEQRVFSFLPNFLLTGGNVKPVIINLDEIGKASRPVQNAFLPLLLERRVGAVKLPPGSKVFGCTNLGAEGVGDLFQPHALNRVSFLEMRYPTAQEWIQFNLDLPADKQAHPAMLAWADENPQLFHSFKQYKNPDDNPYIFHPNQQRRSFCTPRSLSLAAIELNEDRRAAVNDPTATLMGIAGNIGHRAARDLMAFVELADKMPSWNLIVTSPATAPVPSNSPAAMCLTVYSCVAKVEEHTFNAVMTYIQRLPKEVQCMFASQLMKVASKNAWVAMSKTFERWARENAWIACA